MVKLIIFISTAFLVGIAIFFLRRLKMQLVLKVIIIILVCSLITACGLGLAFLQYLDEKLSDSGRNYETNIYSATITAAEARVSILKKNVMLPSTITDAQYELFNVNGFGARQALPGASSYDYKLAVKINPGDFPKWTPGYTQTGYNAEEVYWDSFIRPDYRAEWKTWEKPKYFIKKTAENEMLVYEKSGIIFKRIKKL